MWLQFAVMTYLARANEHHRLIESAKSDELVRAFFMDIVLPNKRLRSGVERS